MIKVILCDDHAMVRRGIRDTVSEAVDIQVVGEAASYPELREQMRKSACDVLVLDLNMPGRGGLEVLAALREEGSSVKTLVVSMYPEDQYAIRCLRAGATGYLNKAGDPAELVTAIRTVMQGRKFVTPEVAQMLVDNLNAPEGEDLHATLSERELQTLQKIASGKKLSEIAEELMLSPKTVSVYRARVLDKLRLSNNAELTVYAIRNNLVLDLVPPRRAVRVSHLGGQRWRPGGAGSGAFRLETFFSVRSEPDPVGFLTGRGMQLRSFFFSFFLALVFLLGACSKPDSHAALEGSVQQLQDHLEAKDRKAVLAMLGPHFRAQDGLDADWASKTMALMFLRYANVKVIAVSSDSRIEPPGSSLAITEAQVVVTGAQGLIPERVSPYAVQLRWNLEGSEWKLRGVRWE